MSNLLLMDISHKDKILLTPKQGKMHTLRLLYPNGKSEEVDLYNDTKLGFDVRWYDHCIHPTDFLEIAWEKDAYVSPTTLIYVIHEFKTNYSSTAFNGSINNYSDRIIPNIQGNTIFHRTFDNDEISIKARGENVEIYAGLFKRIEGDSLIEINDKAVIEHGLLLFTTDITSNDLGIMKAVDDSNYAFIKTVRKGPGTFDVKVVFTQELPNSEVEIFAYENIDFNNEEILETMEKYIKDTGFEVSSLTDLLYYYVSNLDTTSLKHVVTSPNMKVAREELEYLVNNGFKKKEPKKPSL